MIFINNINIIEKLYESHFASKLELVQLISTINDEEVEYLRKKAQETALSVFQNKIYLRGLIEFSSYCKNDCYYCGLQKSNSSVVRYRLSKDEILQCCENGYKLGFKTFVLQGGEDLYFNDEYMGAIVREIREKYPDCAITLSLGERSCKSYEYLFKCGANRYLLRHETADFEHYSKLHPPSMSLKNRIQCLYDLKKLGYQVGAGFMVGSPFQTVENLAEDLMFLHKLKPHMCGIGPFIHHSSTRFANKPDGDVRQCLILLAIIRLMHPNILLPATTALATIDENGREQGILFGANVIMPNLSPLNHRKDYMLYENKAYSGCEAAENLKYLSEKVRAVGYKIVSDRGDYIK